MDLLPVDARPVCVPSSLKPTVTRQEAVDLFERRESGWFRFKPARPLRSIALVHVPYHLFRVEVVDGARRQTRLFAIDAISGTLDPYRFEGTARDIPVEPIHGRNRLAPVIGAEAAWPLLADKLLRVMFQTGFFRLRDPRVSGHPEPLPLHVPYWLGFYADGPFAGLHVLDGVRGTFEGSKARALFQTWLVSGPHQRIRTTTRPSAPPDRTRSDRREDAIR